MSVTLFLLRQVHRVPDVARLRNPRWMSLRPGDPRTGLYHGPDGPERVLTQGRQGTGLNTGRDRDISGKSPHQKSVQEPVTSV